MQRRTNSVHREHHFGAMMDAPCGRSSTSTSTPSMRPWSSAIVAMPYSPKPTDYVLGGELRAIEIYDSDDSWFAHLSLSLRLTHFSTGETLWALLRNARRLDHLALGTHR